ncbi:MAG: hypothetical protein LBN18_04455 [Dysgonamonadaceae bacterium]|nr:hypothetical protein [Dysgonamonadaceae bacterium]
MLIDEIPHPQLKLMTLGFAYVEQKASVHACNTANYSKIKKKMKMKMKRYEEKGINYLINKPRGLFLARHWAEPTPSVGWNQLNNYQNLFQQQYGGTWHTVLDFY